MTCVLHSSELFERLKNGTTVVVPDAAYAANLKQQFSGWAANSALSWQTPLIFSWQDWLKHLWVQQLPSEDCRIILNDLQQRLLWQRVIESDISGHTQTVLWNLKASINQARSAWSLIHDYCLDLSDYPHVVNDVRVFKRWKNEYALQLDHNQWLDPLQLPGLLVAADLCLSNDGIDFFGFLNIKPVQSEVLESIFSSPVTIHRPGKTQVKNLTLFEYSDQDAELNACAQWAREKYEANPLLTIGVLVADLNHSENRVESAFKSVFVPDFALEANQVDVFSITQKSKLVDKCLVTSALNCLGLLAHRFDYELFSRFLTDSYVDRSEQLKHALCLADMKLRSIVIDDVSLDDMIVLLKRIQEHDQLDIAHLMSQLQTLSDYRHSIEHSASIVSWCEHFAAVLKILKWPNFEILNSQDKRLFKHWDQLFANVCTAGLVYPRLTFEQALSLFNNAAASAFFKNPQARISIVDINESAGMNFDAIWICGMSDTVLPNPVKFNPLLPFKLQRDHDLPFSSSSDCELRANLQLEQLFGLASELCFSYYKNDENQSFRASRILTQYAKATAGPLPLPQDLTISGFELESYNDDVGLPLDDDCVIGGSYLLKSQAQCPFKAYAEMRLSVEPVDKRDLGLDSAERGTLVHQVLYKVWKRLKNRSGLLVLSSDELESVIQQEVDKVIGEVAYVQKMFIDVETKRLRQLVGNWLKLEMTRDKDFRINSLELPLTFSRSGLEFTLKVDRIDELEDGSLLLIDYKTGNASKSSWLDQRVQDPQMPVYFFALTKMLGDNVGALAFANTKNLTFDGLCEQDVSMKGINQVENNNRGKLKNFENWGQLRQHWDQNIETLVNEVKQGCASVTPELLSNCKYCGRQSLCRINQHQSLLRNDDDQ